MFWWRYILRKQMVRNFFYFFFQKYSWLACGVHYSNCYNSKRLNWCWYRYICIVVRISFGYNEHWKSNIARHNSRCMLFNVFSDRDRSRYVSLSVFTLHFICFTFAGASIEIFLFCSQVHTYSKLLAIRSRLCSVLMLLF